MAKLKTAKIHQAVAFELSCPDCGIESEVAGPWGSLSIVQDEFSPHAGPAYCIDCGSHLAMPRLPKRVRTQEGARL